MLAAKEVPFAVKEHAWRALESIAREKVGPREAAAYSRRSPHYWRRAFPGATTRLPVGNDEHLDEPKEVE